MPRYGYVVAEGPHDVEFLYRLLSTWELQRIAAFDDLDPYWQTLVPTAFPHKGDLQRRVPVPLFAASATHSVAIHDAGGDTRVVETIQESLLVLDRMPDSVGILLDGDYERLVVDRFATIRRGLDTLQLPATAEAGDVAAGPPTTGVYILPDNASPGTLEDLLIDCAGVEYPRLLAAARNYVQSVAQDPALLVDKKVEFFRPAGTKKAQIACIGSVLKPGRAIQTSIQDNRWLRGDALKLPRIAAVQQFLRALLHLP